MGESHHIDGNSVPLKDWPCRLKCDCTLRMAGFTELFKGRHSPPWSLSHAGVPLGDPLVSERQGNGSSLPPTETVSHKNAYLLPGKLIQNSFLFWQHGIKYPTPQTLRKREVCLEKLVNPSRDLPPYDTDLAQSIFMYREMVLPALEMTYFEQILLSPLDTRPFI